MGEKRLNYKKALVSLEEAIQAFSERSEDRLAGSGLIQNFEFCLELAWKILKYELEQNGSEDVFSPKSVIRAAYEQKKLEDGALWLQMLDDRNDSSHNYDEAQAQALVGKIVSVYGPAFELLHERIK